MKDRIGVIGGGNMGSAIIQRLQADYDVWLCEADQARAQSLQRQWKVRLTGLNTLPGQARVILLAVKPQDLAGVLKELRGKLSADHLIISIAAGIPTGYMEKALGEKTRVIRTMPNMPAMIGQGMTAVCRGAHAEDRDVETACALLSRIGKTVEVEEQWIDAVTAVSGSGPAYVFLFVESFMRAAESLGLDRALSRTLVETTLKGSIELLLDQKEDAATLRARITSKGGTTQAALEVFEHRQWDQIFEEALKAARQRAGELAVKIT